MVEAAEEDDERERPQDPPKAGRPPGGTRTSAVRDVKAELDERKIARGIAIGLPLATLVIGLTAGAIVGPAMAILVFAAGVLLGVIALFWASLRVLSGDAALPPEIEMLDASGHAVDALASRKKMLLRAVKDLEVEHSLGKLDDDDRDQIARMYREELKDVMRRIDASLAPHRPKAEEAVRAHLARAGLAEGMYRGKKADDMVEKEPPSSDDDDAPAKDSAPLAVKVECAKCKTSNDPDAAFCKKCGAGMAKAKAKADADADADEKSDDDDDADAEDEADADVKEKAKESADDAQ